MRLDPVLVLIYAIKERGSGVAVRGEVEVEGILLILLFQLNGQCHVRLEVTLSLWTWMSGGGVCGRGRGLWQWDEVFWTLIGCGRRDFYYKEECRTRREKKGGRRKRSRESEQVADLTNHFLLLGGKASTTHLCHGIGSEQSYFVLS